MYSAGILKAILALGYWLQLSQKIISIIPENTGIQDESESSNDGLSHSNLHIPLNNEGII